MISTQNDTFTQFGELLRYLRVRARMSQRALGQAVGYTGAHVTRLESGERLPDPLIVRARFIDALDLQHEPELAERLISLAGKTNHAQQNPKPDEPASAQWRTNLPVQLTSFIGREREMGRVAQLLGQTRLLTLTGAGGTGKTRLAVEVGAMLAAASVAGRQSAASTFPDGVWLVELAPLSDPTGVPRAVKDALLLPDEVGHSLTTLLIERFASRRLLLILDNCEHLITACAELAEVLLSSCPNLHILSTSREALQCAGEVVWRVPSLAIPETDMQLPLEKATAYEAVQLFIARAASVQSDFQLTHTNVTAVLHICAHLDGIPLAIEMAAAQIAGMSIQEIATRLGDSFALLTSSRRSALPRQRTLRATLDWSYNLLTDQERVLLARLSVFADGCTAELAQAVCSDESGKDGVSGISPTAPSSVILNTRNVLPLLVNLVSKSLVVADMQAGYTRYRLLGTVRQYAAERLAEKGGADPLYRRMAAHFTQPIWRVERVYGDDWHKKLMAELGNIRYLVAWARTSHGDTDTLLQVAYTFASHSPYFGYVAEPLAWLDEGLAVEMPVPATLRAMCIHEKLMLLMFTGYNLAGWSAEADELISLRDHPVSNDCYCMDFIYPGVAAVGRGDLDVAERIFERMRDLSRRSSNSYGIGVSLIHQGLVRLVRGNSDGATALLRQAIELPMGADSHNLPVLKLAGMVWLNADQALMRTESAMSLAENTKSCEYAMHMQVCVQALLRGGQYERAKAYAQRSLDLFRDLGITWNHGFGIAEALLELGRIAWLQDDFAVARAYGEECLDLYLRTGDMEHAAQAHTLIGYAALGLGDLDGAAKSLRRGLTLFNQLNQPAGTVVALAGFAALAEARGDTIRAARLFGTADVPAESLLIWLSTALWTLRLASRVIYDRVMITASKRYAGTAYAIDWTAGKQMTMERAVAYALDC